ncbi:hypothetical protein [Microcoleus anatoxicus]|uniref:hypothetical protein n=1 Tax=Microcoleus anatoxicus TaxID=2705319 RepID=UPI0030C9E57E
MACLYKSCNIPISKGNYGAIALEKTIDRCSVEFLIYILAFKQAETALADRHSAKINWFGKISS